MMKKFAFFEKEVLSGSGANDQFDIQQLEVTACIAGAGFFFVGDATGKVSMFDMKRKMKASFFQPHKRLVSYLALRTVDRPSGGTGTILVTVGDGLDPRPPEVIKSTRATAKKARGEKELDAEPADEKIDHHDTAIKIWEFDPIQPRLLHTVEVFTKWPSDTITAFAVLGDCTQLAVGLKSGAVLLMRGEPFPNPYAAPQAGKRTPWGYSRSNLQQQSSSAVAHLYFSVSQLGDDLISLYVVMTSSGINSIFTTHEERALNPTQVELDARGCEPGRATLSNTKQHLVVGHEKAVEFYTPETKGRVFPIPGAERKQRIYHFSHYLLVACATPQGQTAISVFDMRKGASYVALHMKLGARGGTSRGVGGSGIGDSAAAGGGAGGGGGGGGGGREAKREREYVLFVVDVTQGGSGGEGGLLNSQSASGKGVGVTAARGKAQARGGRGGGRGGPDSEPLAQVLVVTSKHRVYRLVEKDTRTKLEILFRKNLYATAIQLAYHGNYDQAHIAEIYRMHGDHLHAKGDYDGATREYCNTLGHVSPSYVIRKFLDAHRVHNLCDYLEALHSHSSSATTAAATSGPASQAGAPAQAQAHPLHTTLLLNCYTKLKAVSKLNTFVQSQDDHQTSSSPIMMGGASSSSSSSSSHVRKYAFDAVTAIRVLRQMYPYHALHLARSSQQHAWFLRIIIDLHKASRQSTVAERAAEKAHRQHQHQLGLSSSGAGAEKAGGQRTRSGTVSGGSMGMGMGLGLGMGMGMGMGQFDPLYEALEYLWRLDQSVLMEYLPSYGKAILTELPDETTQLIIALCTGRYTPIPRGGSLRLHFERLHKQKGAASANKPQTPSLSQLPPQPDAPESPEQFIHLFVEHPALLRHFLSTIVSADTHTDAQSSTMPVRLHPDVSSSALVGNTLLELLLQELDEVKAQAQAQAQTEGDAAVEAVEAKATEVMALLDSERCQYDVDHALVLVQAHHFKQGQLLLYGKKGMWDMVVQHYQDTGNTRGMIDECIRRGEREPELWLQVLHFFADLAPPSASAAAAGGGAGGAGGELEQLSEEQQEQLQEVLSHIEKMHKLLPPLTVLTIVQRGKRIPLRVVQEYALKVLQHEGEVSEELAEDRRDDEETVAQLRRDIAELRVKRDRLEAKCRQGLSLENDELDYLDEYDQEEDQRVLHIRMAQKEKLTQHEQFFRELASADDGWDLVAEYFSKGLIDGASRSDDSQY